MEEDKQREKGNENDRENMGEVRRRSEKNREKKEKSG